MKIIRKDPNQSGAYPPFQGWHSETPPDGYAVLPDGIDTADFYAYNGFVSLEIEAIEHTHKVEKMVEVERTTLSNVASSAPNISNAKGQLPN